MRNPVVGVEQNEAVAERLDVGDGRRPRGSEHLEDAQLAA